MVRTNEMTTTTTKDVATTDQKVCATLRETCSLTLSRSKIPSGSQKYLEKTGLSNTPLSHLASLLSTFCWVIWYIMLNDRNIPKKADLMLAHFLANSMRAIVCVMCHLDYDHTDRQTDQDRTERFACLPTKKSYLPLWAIKNKKFKTKQMQSSPWSGTQGSIPNEK